MLGVEIPAGAGDDELVVVPEAWPTLRVFLASATQWRMAPSGHLAGLDYRATRAAADGIGIEWRRVFEGMRIMESAVLAAQRERE